jgi:hypothetical protein
LFDRSERILMVGLEIVALMLVSERMEMHEWSR